MAVLTRFPALSLALTLAALSPARACNIALVLAVDVSGSVDSHEFELQSQGIALAIRDPDVQEALVRGQVTLALIQWSGAMEQSLSIPWTQVSEPAEAQALALRIARMPRAHAGGNTAVGEAIETAAALFEEVPHCRHWVIDVSGDGNENEGFTVGQERHTAWSQGIAINGLAIEGAATGLSVTNFYRRHVVTPGGFVITASQHDDFARAMQEKMLRELIPPMAQAPGRLAAPGDTQLAQLPSFLPPQTR